MITQCFKCEVTASDLNEWGLVANDLMNLLGYSYNQAYRIISGKQNMNMQAAELLLIKLDKHPLIKIK